jgi:hypothetical protein
MEVMEMELFERHGAAYGGKVAHTEKGKPYFSRLKRCGRCGGAGGSAHWAMTGWTCYDCHGKGSLGLEAVKLYTAAELAKMNAVAEKKRAKKEAVRMAKVAAAEAEAAAKLAEFMAVHGELVAGAREHAGRSSFLTDLVAKLETYGTWSDKQIAAVAKIVKEIAESDVKKAMSGYVGAIGKRIEMKVTVERVASYRRRSFSGWGEETVWITSMRDEAGNAIVTKTPTFHGYKGESFTLKATVKEHSEYNGEKQTVMMRPKIVGEIAGSPEEEKAA